MSIAPTQKRAILLMMLCASLWSIAGIFIKLIPWNPLLIAGSRSLIAASCVFAYMKKTRHQLLFNRASIGGGIFIALTFLAFVIANKLTTAANAIVLQFTAPVFILIFSAIIFRQRFSRADLFAVIFTTAGISLFFFDQLAPGNLAGNLIAIFAGLSMAFMYIVTGRTDAESRMSGILLGHLFTALVGMPIGLLAFGPIDFTSASIVCILILGIIQLGIPYVLYGIAVKDCPPLACSLLGALEPLLNPVWVFLFDGETPGIFALCGGVVVIATVTIWCIRRDYAQS